MRRLVHLAAAALIACVATAACGGGPVASPFSVEYPAAKPGSDPVPVSLIDQTGLVTAMAVAPEAAAEGVRSVASQPNVLRASWAGGACDDRVTLVLNMVGPGYELAIHNHPRITAGIECDGSAIARAVDITFRQALEPADLTLSITYP